MSEFKGEIVADYTMAAPILHFREGDEELYNAYKQKSLGLLQEYSRILEEKNGKDKNKVYTS